MPRRAARGHGALHAARHCLLCTSLTPSRGGSLPLVPMGTPGHPLVHWVQPLQFSPRALRHRPCPSGGSRPLLPPLKPSSGCTKDSIIRANRGREPRPPPLQPSLRRGERDLLHGPHSSPGERGRSQPSPTDVESHDTASAIHHCILGHTRPHETGLVGKEDLGRGSECLYKRQKKKKKCLPVGEGQYLFVVNSKC